MDIRSADSIDRWENEGGFVNGVRALATMIVVGLCMLFRDSLKDRRREKWIGTLAGLVIVMLASLMIAGCAQNSEQGVNQGTRQGTATPVDQEPVQDAPTTAANESAAAGSTQNIYFINGAPSPPGGAEIPAGVAGDGEGTPVDRALAYHFTGNTVTISGGNVTPSQANTNSSQNTQTPSASASATPSNAPSSNNTQTPTLEAKPSTSGTAAVNLPGSSNNQQATATAEGQTSGTTQTATQTSSYQRLQADVDALKKQNAALQQQLNQLLGIDEPPPPSPTSGPAEGAQSRALTREQLRSKAKRLMSENKQLRQRIALTRAAN